MNRLRPPDKGRNRGTIAVDIEDIGVRTTAMDFAVRCCGTSNVIPMAKEIYAFLIGGKPRRVALKDSERGSRPKVRRR
jgi:hypothetical protein